MPRRITFSLAATIVLLVPVGASWAQTTTSSTTSVVATSSTTTTLPLCFPLNPTHQLGVTCQLPGIDCPPPNPPPPCGNFPNPQPPLVPTSTTIVADAGPAAEPSAPAVPSARLNLTG